MCCNVIRDVYPNYDKLNHTKFLHENIYHKKNL